MKRTHWLTFLLITSFISFLSIGCDDDVKKKTNNDNVNNITNPVCGNGLLETGETCDGTALGGEDCTTIEGNFTGGTLACAAGCTAFDTAGCTAGCTDACTLDNRVCNGDTLRVCETDSETGCTVWNDTDCTTTSETCQVIEEVAQCAACTDACTINAERCNAGDNGIETCVLGGAGCTVWSNAPCPQATPDCEVQVGEPTCVSNCVNACVLDAKQCNLAADGIETCVNGASGCTEWQNAACGVATPECQDLAGTPTCLAPNGSGESCSDVYTISIPFYTEGTDITADFTADMAMNGTGCTFGWTMSGVDAVFAVALTAGEEIIFAQGGGVDAGIYIQSICDAAGECLDAMDDYTSNGTEAILFEAPADGVYYLIVKVWSASPSTRTYAIAAWYYEDPAELTCDDGFDNDLDGLVDCEDPDCFGLGACTTETVCDDGLDNDLDGDLDCADADCTAIEPCGAETTADRCGDGIDNDNDGDTDCADTDCAGLGPCGPETTVAFCADGIDNDNDGMIDCMDTDCNGIGACGPENTEAFCADGLDNDADGLVDCYDGDCLMLARCQTGESCADPPPIGLPFRAFGPNFGAYYNNHNFYNTAGGCGTANGNELIFAVTLTAGQQIRMDETGALDAVIRVLGACTDVNPVCLVSSDTPETNLLFTAPADGTYFLVLEAYSSTTTSAYDFSVFTVTASEAGLCADGVDNDVDGQADCNDSECFGQTGCTTELNCNDGLDNDADTFIDCSDPDCAAAINCLGGDSCADALPVTLPFNATGTDITADFTNLHTFTSATCTVTGGVEAVFSVALTAGQRIRLNETGTMDAQLRVLPECTTTNPVCLINSDPETNIIFTAPADGTYFVILETYSASPTNKGYNFTIDLIPDTELNCGDTLDNDLDGRVDCNDPDCFGETGCTTELNCGDGFDNDDDGFVDCDDLDCAAATACELGEGCANPLLVTTFPYNVTGTNFGADFANDHTFSSATCTVTGGPEAVFEVDLLAGERLRLNETGALDAQLRVLPACTTTAPVCLVNSDPETNILFTAPADGTYYVVLESYFTTSTAAYNFTIEKFDATETNCGDTVDNDGDGAIDCTDSDCFGVGSCPTAIFTENFNVWPLTGWTIVDGGTSTHTWASSATGTARSLTGATGLYAKVDSDAAGSTPVLDESLITPSINCAGFTTITLNFRHYYYHTTGQTGQVDVSTDAGANWTNVANYTTSSTNGAIANINISTQAAGQADVRIRWRYTGQYDWYWLIDDVAVFAN